MIIQAELRRKQSEYEGEACSVDSAAYIVSMTISGRKVFRCSLTAIYKSRTKNVIYPAAEKFS